MVVVVADKNMVSMSIAYTIPIPIPIPMTWRTRPVQSCCCDVLMSDGWLIVAEQRKRSSNAMSFIVYVERAYVHMYVCI